MGSAGIQICSMSGGTDLCTAFLESAPQCRYGSGNCRAPRWAHPSPRTTPAVPVIDEVGELVLTKPMPSMPVSFWKDPDGSRLRTAYFADFPALWRHGDWVRQTPRGSFVIYGRSDSTLNRGGVRMGTADFYAVVEGFEEIIDSLVVDTTELGATDEGELLCFVVSRRVPAGRCRAAAAAVIRNELSPRHVPDQFIAVDAIPHTLNGKKCEVP